MLKGSLSPYLDTHNEEESSYVTLSNGPYAYVADSTSAEHNSYNHILTDVYFVTPLLCKHCEDYIWGTGKVGVKCKEVNSPISNVEIICKTVMIRYKRITEASKNYRSG
ncbi:protein kinase C delta type-like isoform X1 [Anoplolepis gracilipes]|uniref:protein kinase C delta type-like isoform X1 n=1 Tax=Anoplolepis gracilipes TaxID=354296 RepID=UPI003B9E1E80